MKLSELVKLRRSLEYIFPGDYEYPLQSSLNSLTEGLDSSDKMARLCIHDLKNAQENISKEFGNIRQSLDDYKRYIQNCINDKEDEYYSISNEIYQEGLNDDANYILKRRSKSLTLSDEENKNLFLSRLGEYNSWKYPALEIRPAFGEITDFIKGCDPLYLVDTDEDLFKSVKRKWNPIYQRRLRFYTINENDEQILQALPDNQFGLICSVDYFNFKPINLIKSFLQEFYTKLRPGGVAMFTYNNCDLPYAVKNVENRFCCYTPGHSVIETAQEIGFEIIKNIDRLENISWLEIRKPGEINTLRGGQTLGEICSFD